MGGVPAALPRFSSEGALTVSGEQPEWQRAAGPCGVWTAHTRHDWGMPCATVSTGGLYDPGPNAAGPPQ